MKKFNPGEKVMCDGRVRTIYGIYPKNHVSLCLIDEEGYEYRDTEEDEQTPINQLIKLDFSSLKCPHCGGKVEESQTDGYSAFCHNCDEDFYSFELSAPIQKKKKFPFFLDQKTTVWCRTPFEIEADTLEEAQELAKTFVQSEEINEISWEILDDTIEVMELSENDNQATQELFDETTAETIWGNNVSR